MAKELTPELKLAMASVMQDPAKRLELAEMIVEYVDVGHITFDFIGQLIATRSLNTGDMLIKKLRKGIKVWSHVPGTIPMKSEITISERLNYILDYAVTGVTANTQELAQGDLGTVESMRTEMMAKLRDFYIGKVFTALTTIWTAANTPSNYATIATAVDKTTLDAMIKVIIRSSGGVKAIVGVRDVLQPITEFVGWAVLSGATTTLIQNIGEELARTGWVGSYKGIPLVIVPRDYTDPESFTLMVPDNKILVIGDNAGEFITYGAPQSQEYTDPRIVPPQWNLNIWQSFGFIIDYASRVGVIKIT